MRKATFILGIALVGLLSGAILATVGLISNQSLYGMLAIWAFTVSFMVFFVFMTRVYHRTMTRTRTTTDLLAEMKFLQERRYEQLAKRLDNMSPLRGHRSGTSSTSEVSGNPSQVGYSELRNINERLQRAERRILGKLENEALSADEQVRELDRLIASLRNDSRRGHLGE